MLEKGKNRILATVNFYDSERRHDLHCSYYVPGINVSFIEKDPRITGYRFSVHSMEENTEYGNEIENEELYRGPQVFVGNIITLEEGAFIFGLKTIALRFSGDSHRDGTKVLNAIIKDDNKTLPNRLCVVGEGDDVHVLPMYPGDVTEEEYIKMLSKFPSIVERLESGVNKDCEKVNEGRAKKIKTGH